MFIRSLHGLHPGKRAHQHEQRAFRQVEIGHQHVDRPEKEARRNEDVGFAQEGLQFAGRTRRRFKETQRGRADGDKAATLGPGGRKTEDVRELLQKFGMMQQVMGTIGQNPGLLGRIPGFKQMGQLAQLKNMDLSSVFGKDPKMMEKAMAGMGMGGMNETHAKLLVSIARGVGVNVDSFGYTAMGTGGLPRL